ncbi:MAG: hypothetical protein ABL308_01020 [Oceanicaulis sp.]
MLAQAIEPVWALLAAALSAAGALALFESWRRRAHSHRRLMAGGWLALIASAPFWIAASGPDRGAAMAALAAMAAVSIVLAVQYARPDGKPRRNPDRVAAAVSVPIGAGRVLRTVYVAVLATLAALAASVCLSGTVYAGILGAGLAQPDALFWSVLVLPVSWGGLMVIPALDLPLRTRSLIMAGALAAAGAMFALASLV